MFGGRVTGDQSNGCRARITVAFGAFDPTGCLQQLDDAGTCGVHVVAVVMGGRVAVLVEAVMPAVVVMAAVAVVVVVVLASSMVQ